MGFPIQISDAMLQNVHKKQGESRAVAVKEFPLRNFEWLKSAVCGIIADSPIYIYIYIRCYDVRNSETETKSC